MLRTEEGTTSYSELNGKYSRQGNKMERRGKL
jgi:hypothetical protein